MKPRVLIAEQDIGGMLAEMAAVADAIPVMPHDAHDAIDQLKDIKLIFLDDDNAPFIETAKKYGYSGGVILCTNYEISQEEVKQFGFAETWKKPLTFEALTPGEIAHALIQKHLSTTPRILYYNRSAAPKTVWHLREQGYTVLERKQLQDLYNTIPNSHAAVIIAQNPGDGFIVRSFISRCREKYAREEFPVLVVIKENDKYTAITDPCVFDKRPEIKTETELEKALKKMLPEKIRPVAEYYEI